jgi:hypothetical protein
MAIIEKCRQLCLQIEQAGASEQLTRASVLASEVVTMAEEMQRQHSKKVDALNALLLRWQSMLRRVATACPGIGALGGVDVPDDEPGGHTGKVLEAYITRILEDNARLTQRQTAGHTFTLSHGAMRWLNAGEHGISSLAIFSMTTGLQVEQAADHHRRENHPYDPGDVRRCELLLRTAPDLREAFPRMRSVSSKWAALVDHWDEIIGLMDEEAPHWAEPNPPKERAPKAYSLIQQCIERRP